MRRIESDSRGVSFSCFFFSFLLLQGGPGRVRQPDCEFHGQFHARTCGSWVFLREQLGWNHDHRGDCDSRDPSRDWRLCYSDSLRVRHATGHHVAAAHVCGRVRFHRQLHLRMGVHHHCSSAAATAATATAHVKLHARACSVNRLLAHSLTTTAPAPAPATTTAATRHTTRDAVSVVQCLRSPA
jgi:hypothetical protein